MPIWWPSDQPTLGPLAAAWIEAHCKVTDGFLRGKPFVLDGWQLECVFSHYRVKPEVRLGKSGTSGARQFQFRRSLWVGPQKTGKSPVGAAVTNYEAVGPCLHAGWAKGGEVYCC